MKNNKKGFTLIELLAVIVVLAIIMVIATGAVTRTIQSARVNSFKSSYDMIVKNIKDKINMNKLGYNETIICDDSNTNTCSDLYDYSSEDYFTKIEFDASGNYDITFEGKGKFKNIDLDNNITEGYTIQSLNNNKNIIKNKLNSNGQSIYSGLNDNQSLILEFQSYVERDMKSIVDNNYDASNENDYVAGNKTDYKSVISNGTANYCGTGNTQVLFYVTSNHRFYELDFSNNNNKKFENKKFCFINDAGTQKRIISCINNKNIVNFSGNGKIYCANLN